MEGKAPQIDVYITQHKKLPNFRIYAVTCMLGAVSI